MPSSFRTLTSFVAGAAVLLQSAAPVAAADPTFPAAVEIDLVFPRAGVTYKPGPNFPVVLAVQNAPAAASLDMLINIMTHNNSKSELHQKFVGLFDASNNTAVFASNSPSTFYWHVSTNKFKGTVPTNWTLEWMVLGSNCTMDDDSTNLSDHSTADLGLLSFFTDPAGIEPDLVAIAGAEAKNDTACKASISHALTYNVSAVRNVTTDLGKHGRHNETRSASSCAVLPSARPSANPCAARLDAAAASAIAGSLNSTKSGTTVAGGNSTTGSGTPKKNSGAAALLGRQSSLVESALLLAAVGWLVYL